MFSFSVATVDFPSESVVVRSPFYPVVVVVPVFGSDELAAPFGDVKGDFAKRQATGQLTFAGSFEQSVRV